MKELRLLAYFHSPGGGGGREKITLPPEKSKKKKVDEVEKERGGLGIRAKSTGQNNKQTAPTQMSYCASLYTDSTITWAYERRRRRRKKRPGEREARSGGRNLTSFLLLLSNSTSFFLFCSSTLSFFTLSLSPSLSLSRSGAIPLA
jgi:DNA-binding PucR family transcriptional regulator